MIESVSIKNFKCFKDFSIDLDRFTVLIGPNDTGKSTLLEAIRLAAFGGHTGKTPLGNITAELRLPLGPEIAWRGETENQVSIAMFPSSQGVPGANQVYFRFLGTPGQMFESATPKRSGGPIEQDDKTPVPPHERERIFSGAIGNPLYFEFGPSALRKKSSLGSKMLVTGEGFPSFLDDMLRKDPKQFLKMAEQFYARFPHYKKIVIADDGDAFFLEFHTVHDEILPPHSVSDGVMLSLAYLALNYSPDPPRIMLIEEPENGVHHASLKDIVGTLQSLSDNRGVQVILTTHSPYLLDLVKPEEVRLFRKDAEGAVHAVKMSDLPDVQDMKKHFMTGEIWTGMDEADASAKVRGQK